MRLAVIGSRGFTDYDLMCKTLDEYKKADPELEIVSGGARGADQLAAKYAKENNLMLIEFFADWEKYGNSAGYKRNKLLIDYADQVVAFWDSESKGTLISINLAMSSSKSVKVIKYTAA